MRRFSSAIQPLVKTSLNDGIQLISINRAAKRNCVNHETALQLIKTFESFEDNKEAKIAILHGEGDNFCAGYDLSDVAKGDFDVEPDFLPKYRYMGPTAMKLRKPLLAAVEGFAVAGGLELALLADMRIVSESATFGVFCRRVGVPLIDGGTVRLPRVIGQGRALDLILTGRAVEAPEALQMGLANRVVPKGTAVSYAMKLAKEIISHPEDCLLFDRRSCYASLDRNFDEAMEFELGSLSIVPKAIKEAGKFMKKEVKSPSKL